MKKEQNRTLTRGDMHDLHGLSVLFKELYDRAVYNYYVDRLPMPNTIATILWYEAILRYERENKKEAK